jgi:adenylate cyclase
VAPEDPTRLACQPHSSQNRMARALASHDLVRWILTDGRLVALGRDPTREPGSPERFIHGVCAQLVAAGVPLWRVALYAATLHPQIRGVGWHWARERAEVEEVSFAQGVERTAEFLRSPLREAIEHGTVLRRRLEGTHGELPFLGGLRTEGCTEYLARPLNHAIQRYPVVVWATDRAGGFADSDLALLDDIWPALAAIVETIMTLRTARNLFSIYLGHHVGERVLNGQILRGHAEPLRAVIMATDLRDFTGLTDRLPSEEVIRLLDDYFEDVASTAQAHGGSVLKFIGDGVLAIFGTDGDEDRVAARAALAAASEIVARLAARRVHGNGLRAGIGLHVGTVLYGNVGSSDRLDFTVVGPAVNLAFRLEALTKGLGHPVVASRAFAAAAGLPLVSLGVHPIRGFRDREEVFGLPEQSPAPLPS